MKRQKTSIHFTFETKQNQTILQFFCCQFLPFYLLSQQLQFPSSAVTKSCCFANNSKRKKQKLRKKQNNRVERRTLPGKECANILPRDKTFYSVSVTKF
jgi:hypothetical protein